MSNQKIQFKDSPSHIIDQQLVLQRFDAMIDLLCKQYEQQNITDGLKTLRPLMNSDQFRNLVGSVVTNTSYNYGKNNYDNFSEVATRLIHEFNPREQSYLIANMHLYDIGYSRRLAKFVESLFRKVLMDKLMQQGNLE